MGGRTLAQLLWPWAELSHQFLQEAVSTEAVAHWVLCWVFRDLMCHLGLHVCQRSCKMLSKGSQQAIVATLFRDRMCLTHHAEEKPMDFLLSLSDKRATAAWRGLCVRTL